MFATFFKSNFVRLKFTSIFVILWYLYSYITFKYLFFFSTKRRTFFSVYKTSNIKFNYVRLLEYILNLEQNQSKKMCPLSVTPYRRQGANARQESGILPPKAFQWDITRRVSQKYKMASPESEMWDRICVT